MGTLVIAAGDLIQTAGTNQVGILGEAASAGDVLYHRASDGRWYLAPATVAAGAKIGILVSGNGTAGQPAVIASGSDVVLTVGAILTTREIYVLSPAANGKIAPISDLAGSVNEIQSVSISGATGGTFTLSFDGQTTAAIAFDATAATVKAALEALSNIDLVAASGGPMNTAAVSIEFQGTNASTDVAEMTIDATGLTGTVASSVATTTAGAAGATMYLIGYAESQTSLALWSRHTGVVLA